MANVYTPPKLTTEEALARIKAIAQQLAVDQGIRLELARFSWEQFGNLYEVNFEVRL